VVLYNSNLDSNFTAAVIQILPFYAVILGGLMVSSVPYPHFAKWLMGMRRNRLALVGVIFFLFLMWRPCLVTAVCVNTYILLGPLKHLSRKMFGGKKKREDAA